MSTHAPGSSPDSPDGGRRLDRVLAEDYLTGLRDGTLDAARALRDEAEQEEVDLSYVRRLIQGRMDIVRAELNRREGPGTGSVVDNLAQVLADEPRSSAHGLGRHSTVEPSRIDSHRRYVEALVADVDLSDTEARTTDELHHAMRVLSDEEQVVSAKRRLVQSVMDACSAEITRRYREGEADVSTLLDAESSSHRSHT
ncbi:MAG: AmfC protein [Frankiales bacterium]|nr:AmfC protein [Frankiales bacterium]